MITTLTATTTSRIVSRLVEHEGTSGSSRVLTLVISTDEAGLEEALCAAHGASRDHPCRVIAVVKPPEEDADRVRPRSRDGHVSAQAGGHLDAVSSLWTSPIARARETIAPVERATGLSAHVESGLREVLAGDLEMRTDARSVACYTDTTRAWMIGRTAARLPGSPEDGADTFGRFNDVVARIACATHRIIGPDGEGTALLVAHGTVLRLWTALAAAPGGGIDPDWVAEHPMGNASTSLVEGDPDSGWRLISWNEGEWRASP